MANVKLYAAEEQLTKINFLKIHLEPWIMHENLCSALKKKQLKISFFISRFNFFFFFRSGLKCCCNAVVGLNGLLAACCWISGAPAERLILIASSNQCAQMCTQAHHTKHL